VEKEFLFAPLERNFLRRQKVKICDWKCQSGHKGGSRTGHLGEPSGPDERRADKKTPPQSQSTGRGVGGDPIFILNSSRISEFVRLD